MLGKRKRVLSGLPAQAAYAKHAKLLAVTAKVAEPERKHPEPPNKLIKYYQGNLSKCSSSCKLCASANTTPVFLCFWLEPWDCDAAAPVTKRRRGFFSQPTEKDVKQAQEDAKANNSKESSKSIGHKGEPDHEESAGDVFRNVIHELKDRGLPVEMHYARTDDGYWIPVVRIPAKGAAHTVA